MLLISDYIIPLPPIDRSFKQKESIEMLELTDITNYMDLTYIRYNRTFHLNTKEYPFFLTIHETFTNSDTL